MPKEALWSSLFDSETLLGTFGIARDTKDEVDSRGQENCKATWDESRTNVEDRLYRKS